MKHEFLYDNIKKYLLNFLAKIFKDKWFIFFQKQQKIDHTIAGDVHEGKIKIIVKN